MHLVMVGGNTQALDTILFFFHHSDINQYKDANFIIQAFKTMLEEDSFVFEENIQIALF